MLFKMILDAATKDERPIVRGLLKHLLGGFAIGTAAGAVMLFFLTLSLRNLDIDIHPLFLLAMMLQIGTGGGFVGTVLYMSRVTDRDKDDEDEDDDDKPGGGTRAPVTPVQPIRAKPVVASGPLPKPA